MVKSREIDREIWREKYSEREAVLVKKLQIMRMGGEREGGMGESKCVTEEMEGGVEESESGRRQVEIKLKQLELMM